MIKQYHSEEEELTPYSFSCTDNPISNPLNTGRNYSIKQLQVIFKSSWMNQSQHCCIIRNLKEKEVTQHNVDIVIECKIVNPALTNQYLKPKMDSKVCTK